jgi:hypothetical protein
MPWGSVVLKPGVDVEKTPTLNQAGYSTSRLIRYKAGLAQKIGGWERFYANAVGGTPRAMHAWQDINEDRHLAVGTTQALGVITDGLLTSLTPQQLDTNFLPDFSTTASSVNIFVTDPEVSNPTAYDAVEFLTPISVGGAILSGAYPIDLVLSATTYNITSATDATLTRVNATIAGATQANPCEITAVGHGFSTGDLIYIDGVVGMTQLNNRIYTITSTGADTFTLDGVNSTAYTAYSSDGVASPSAVPFFSTTAGSPIVDVTLQDHGLSVGGTVVFPISTSLQASVVTITIATPGVVTWFQGSHGMTGNEAIVFTTTGALPTGLTAGTTYYVLASGITATTFSVAATPGGTAIDTTGAQSGIHTATVGGLSIEGTYIVTDVADVDTFSVAISSSAAATATVPMNGGDARLRYHIALGPIAESTGYSVGSYSDGTYSEGATISAQEGDPITAVDWTHDNWGSTLLSCPEGGGIYEWTPDSGFETARLISAAPIYNAGIFVAAPAQILIAYGSTEYHTIGVDRDPLTYSWSDQLDYAFWEPGVVNPATGLFSQAGSNRIPTGSKIVAGLQAPQQALLWTDLDLWALSYIGNPTIGTFGQTKVSSSCGAIGSHAIGQLGNAILWMGRSNFFAFSGGGVQPMPCSVWDAVFQDLDEDNAWKVRAAPNTPFNEMWWFYPSASGGSGENDSYVKVNITDGAWDYGPVNALARSAWIDQSVLGMPIGASPQGLIYQHETGEDADGQAISWSFKTGYWMIAEGQNVSFVDFVVPDFKYGTFNGPSNASIQITLYSVMYPGDTERVYGPYTVTSSSTYIRTRLRGRQMAMKVSGSDLGSFARLGSIKFNYQPDGRF